MSEPGKIVTLDEFLKIKTDNNLGQIVLTSGGFDPMHPGHASCLIESKKHGDTLVVLVNGDTFLINKKGKAFQDLDSRCFVVSCIKEVDFVIPYESKVDMTVCEPLRQIKPAVFTKGGDRTDVSSIPEWAVCQEINTVLIPNVGIEKAWSSSNFLKNWEEFVKLKTVLICNLPEQADIPEITEILQKFGEVQSVEIFKFNDANKETVNCIASMFNENQADIAVKNLNNLVYKGEKLFASKTFNDCES